MELGLKTSVIPSQPAGEHWSDVCVKAPAGPFKLVAAIDSGGKWFAFKAPRELGRFSYWTTIALAGWKYFLVIGLGWFLINLALFRREKDL
jgi:hypothetical protein